jgi:hypothetical protein
MNNSTNTTREIQLSDKLVQLVTTLQNDLKALQEQYKVKSEHLGTTLAGVCLQEDIDLSTVGLELSADYTVIYVKPITPAEETNESAKTKKK